MASQTSLSSNSRSTVRLGEGDRAARRRRRVLLRLPVPTRGDFALLALGGVLGYVLGGGSLGAGFLSLLLVGVVGLVVFVVATRSVPFVDRRIRRFHHSSAPTVTIVGAVIFVAAVGLAEFAILSISVGAGIVVAIGAFVGWRFYVRSGVTTSRTR